MAAPGNVISSLSHINFLISLVVCLTFAMNFEITNHCLTLSLIFFGISRRRISTKFLFLVSVCLA